MKRLLHTLTGVLLCAGLSAQVRVDRPINLTGSTDGDRQVHGVPDATAPQDLLNSAVEGSGVHRTATAQAGNIWAIQLDALAQAPAAGTHVLVHAPAPAGGPVQLTVNGHGPFAVLYVDGSVLEGSAIPAGSVLSLVHDGTAFQVTNGTGSTLRPCPAGTVAVNEQFCVQQQRHPEQLLFFEAIETCGAQGLRLCSWGELYLSCANAGALGIAQMPGGWEWTDQTANEQGSVRIATNGSCFQASTSLTTVARYLRCCASR
jgi:hypothetical protein